VYAGSVYWPFHLDKSRGLTIAVALAVILIVINIIKTVRSVKA
jgi:hypothetical protein